MTIKERILEFIKAEGITVKGFETSASLSNGYIRQLRKAPSLEKIHQITAAYPHLSASWLLTGEGNMLNETIEVEEVEKDEPQVGEEYLVPLVPVGAFAGSLSGFDIQGTDARNCELVVSPIPRMDWAVEVVGDSMESEYPNGSRVFVKKVNSAIFLEWGCVYVIDTDNGLVMKSIRPSRDPDCITCVSLNPRYAPFDVPKESIRAMYRVWACLTLK